jgi:hypothetical protein
VIALPYVVGIVLGLLIALFTRSIGLDRDRGIYPIILIVIGSYYVLFAVMGGSVQALIIETVVMLAFTLVAVRGFTRNLWWIAAGMAGHALFDFVGRGLIENPGVPVWWPAFCGSIDVALAAWLGWLLYRSRSRPEALRAVR